MLKFIKRWGGKIYFRGVAFLIIGKKGKTMPDTERIIQEFDQLVSRHGKLILFLCQRASYGRVGMCSELRQECYAELLLRLAERGTALEGTREKAWVYGRCRVAIDRYLRHLRHLSTLPFPEGMEEMLAAPAETPQQVAADFAATLGEAERRFFLLLAKGANDETLERTLGLKHRTVIQMKHNIKKKLKEYIYENKRD